MISAEILKGKWNEIKGEIFKKWSLLTENEVNATGGNLLSLIGLLQQKMGMSKEEAEKSLDGIVSHLSEKIENVKSEVTQAVNSKIDSTKQFVKNASPEDLKEDLKKALVHVLTVTAVVGLGITAFYRLIKMKNK